VKLLLLKDLYTQKISVYFLSLLWFILFTNFFTSGEPVRHVILISIVAFFLTMSTNGEQNSTFEKESVLINSLPCTRKQVVLSKYLSGFMWFAISAVTGIIYIFLFDMFAPFPTRMIHLNELLIALCGTFILLAIFYPLLFKTNYFIASILTFIIPFIVIIGIQMIANMMENPNTAFIYDYISIITANQNLITTVFASVSVLFVLISFNISVRIYRNKDLHA